MSTVFTVTSGGLILGKITFFNVNGDAVKAAAGLNEMPESGKELDLQQLISRAINLPRLLKSISVSKNCDKCPSRARAGLKQLVLSERQFLLKQRKPTESQRILSVSKDVLGSIQSIVRLKICEPV